METVAESFPGAKRVAFFAIVERGSLGRVRGDTNIIFERDVTNVGEAYDKDSGQFTAPFKGLYQFSSSIMADNGAEVWCRFTLNDKPVAYIYARGTDNRHAQGSQTVILQLKEGDKVAVQNQYDTRIYGDQYTTFSGFSL